MGNFGIGNQNTQLQVDMNLSQCLRVEELRVVLALRMCNLGLRTVSFGVWGPIAISLILVGK